MRLVQVALGVTDLTRAAAFYERLTGRAPSGVFDPPGLVFFDMDGVRLLLEHGAPPALLYLGVDDLDATIARLRSDGTPIESEPHPIFTHETDALGPAGTTELQAFIRDSEGNLLGLVQHRPDA
ncbi:VOC family protein [Microbacterium sp. X-17]|uniref:VOC family protein n=1 Tax=Microbacterium sp. X-17 TaxID=3144404 RepID=UPI0031F5951C